MGRKKSLRRCAAKPMNWLIAAKRLAAVSAAIFCFLPVSASAAAKVAVIGSSSTVAGCGQSGGFINLLKQKLSGSHTFDCFAKTGEKTDWMWEQYQANVANKNYQELIIYGGLNDLYATQSKSTFAKDNLTKIFQAAKQAGLRVIALPPQPSKFYSCKPGEKEKWTATIGQETVNLKNWLAGLPAGLDIFVDTYSIFDKNGDQAIDEGMHAGDCLHPSTAAHELIYKSILAQAYGGPAVPGLPVSGGGTPNQNPASDPLTKLFADISDPQQAESELQKLLQKPNPKIKIPGLVFSDIGLANVSQEEDGSLYLEFPFLGEYLAAVYLYLVVAASVIAVVLIIIAGLQWALPSAGGENIEAAKKRIRGALIGLALSVGSYSILYLINPELVNFRNLRVRYIPGLSTLEVVGSATYQAVVGASPLSPEQATAAAVTAGQQAGLTDGCLMKTILKMESGGRVNVVGHDENAKSAKPVSARKKFLLSGLKFSKDTFAPPVTDPEEFDYKIHNKNKEKNDDGFGNTPPDYGLDWRFTHGFGLGQITFGGDSHCNGGRGITRNGRCYTIPDLLSPQANLELSAAHFKNDLECAGKKGLAGLDQVRGAFYAYNAGCGGLGAASDSTLASQPYASRAIKLYEDCRQGK